MLMLLILKATPSTTVDVLGEIIFYQGLPKDSCGPNLALFVNKVLLECGHTHWIYILTIDVLILQWQS